MRFCIALLCLLGACATAEEQPKNPLGSCTLLCGPSERVTAGLALMGEKVVGRGVTGGGALLEFWRGDETWTVVMTTPSGESCLLSSGQGWEPVVMGRGV